MVTHSLPVHVNINFLWRTFSEGHSTESLYLQYVFGLASWTGPAGPQPSYWKWQLYHKETGSVNVPYLATTHAEGQEANGIIDIKVPIHTSPCLDARSYHSMIKEAVLSLLPAHTTEIMLPELSLNWSSSTEPSYSCCGGRQNLQS